MPYDEKLVERVRGVLAGKAFEERKMFGGLTFMLQGNMCCGVAGERLMVRVGPEKYDEALGQKHAQLMDFTGRPMKGFVFVGSEGLASAKELEAWVRRGVDFALSLPSK
ncbi:MAG: TfoX/Sxy family protein [Chloroflexi bacterium]|nr:TfoX/Sxy family protein [Chloroflexota bacterium]